MNILLARQTEKSKPKKISIKTLKEQLNTKIDKLFYFDKDNTHKQMLDLVELFEKDNYTVHLREIKYGLDEDNYMYEIHFL
jgi:dynactin complex subunit